ncbi:MAG TPA: ferrous iron transport protein B, partial [Patescibacteria group bacterium]|nr:ferrous iron transport protein B [Patescibacteria group bacterium]
LVVYLMFKVTFALSAPLVAAVESIFSALASSISVGSLPSLAASLLKDGIIGGIGSVVVFVPLIFILFLVIAFLEDSGYLSRAVVLTDRVFQRFGITGRSLIPMILGFGCNVPAIMSGRTIKQEKERKIAMFVNPFISCSARLPVYLIIASIFFPGHSTLAVFSLYILGVVIAFLVSYVYSKISGKAEEAGMIIELPPYRRPNIKNVLRSGWNNTYLFLKKAGTLILVASLAVWLLASLPVGVEYGGEASLLGIIGKKMSFLFDPLGFGHWAFAVSLLFGVMAKETIISTLGALFGVGEKGLAAALPQIIDAPGALAFLCFVLLYIPCLATIATVKKETGSWRFVFSQILVTFIVAWIVAYIVNQVAGWLI